ncbi:MAG: Hsp70 family protein, partial [Alcaligenes sp.]
ADHAVTKLAAGEFSPADRRGLLMAARAAREALSTADSATLKLPLSDGRDVDLVLTRAEFEALAQPLIERTLDCARRALRDASLKPADVRGRSVCMAEAASDTRALAES